MKLLAFLASIIFLLLVSKYADGIALGIAQEQPGRATWQGYAYGKTVGIDVYADGFAVGISLQPGGTIVCHVAEVCRR